MVACKQLTFGKHMLLLLMFLGRPSHRTALGRFTWSWKESTCVAKGRQPKAKGLVYSSGPDLLSQLDLFLEIYFPAWRQSAISKRGWTSITSVDLALSILPGT